MKALMLVVNSSLGLGSRAQYSRRWPSCSQPPHLTRGSWQGKGRCCSRHS